MDLEFIIKGKLSQNWVEKDLPATVYDMDFTLLMHQLFDMRGDKYRNWHKEDGGLITSEKVSSISLCIGSNKDFEPTPANITIMRDCWCVLVLLFTHVAIC
jgi:hypothetical protein